MIRRGAPKIQSVLKKGADDLEETIMGGWNRGGRGER